MFDLLVVQLKTRDGITEKLKATNHMEWVRCMNAIRKEAESMVLVDLIYE